MNTRVFTDCNICIVRNSSDDLLTDSHWLGYSSAYLQALGLGFVVANSLNMAANGDQAIDKKATVTATAAEPVA